MTDIVYVNDTYVPAAEATISIFDRGFLFADGVYEVCTVIDGQLIDNARHLARLRRSLNELSLEFTRTDAEIIDIQKTLIEKNGLTEGMIYLQVTRGAAPRSFDYPANATPTLVMFAMHKQIIDNPQAETGIRIASVPDIRWARRDIKTVGLLPASMSKMAAAAQGADDAWMVEDGLVTEGSSNNAYIINTDGVIVTRHLGNEILSGITRTAILEIAQREGLQVEERGFSIDEALIAAEAFISSATTMVMPVVEIDGQIIGDGRPGDITRRLRQGYIDLVCSGRFAD